MSRIIAISSGKGGVGKTTAAANLGAALAARGQKTVLVDLDLGLRNLDVALGLETRVFYHLGDVLTAACELDEALVTDPERYPGLALLPAAQALDDGVVNLSSLRMLTDMLKKQFDMILVDSPAGIGPVFGTLIRCADEGIVVTAPVVAAVRDADKVLHLMEEAGIRKRSVLVNNVRPELVKKGFMMKPEDITDTLGVDLIGAIPDDDNVIIYANEGKALTGSRTPAGLAFDRIAARLMGEDVPVSAFKKKKKGLFRR